MDELFTFLNSIYPVSIELSNYLVSHLKQKSFHKKGLLLVEKQVSDKIYFIQKGIVRGFYNKNDKDISSWFMKEGDVVISIESFFMQKESQENVQALEDTIVCYITYQELQFMYQTYLEFNYIGRVLVERYYCLSEQRSYLLRMQTSSCKYYNLLENHPELIRRVPSIYLASYLGITLETLSRMKKPKSKGSVV